MGFRLRLATCALLCATAAGCSTDVQAGDEEHARSAVTTLLSLCAEGRGVDALALLSVPAQRVFVQAADVRAGCERVVDIVPEGADAALETVFEQARVRRVHVDGGLARVEITAPHGWRTTLEAEDVGDDWLVTNTRLPDI